MKCTLYINMKCAFHKLQNDFCYCQLSTGDLLRDNVKNKTPAGIKAKEAMDKGQLVSDGIVNEILVNAMKSPTCERGIIFDGYPRTIKQARKLDSLLGKLGLGLNHAIFMDLPEEKAKERIRNRAKKEGRKDDASDEVIDKRFSEYNEKTFPLVDFYKKSRKLIKIDADLGMEGVLKAIVKKLGLKEVKDKKDEKI